MTRLCHHDVLQLICGGDPQQVIKPFSSRVAQYGGTVAGCTPTTPGTVSAASVGAASDSSGPGPENFQAPDSATCCSSALLAIGKHCLARSMHVCHLCRVCCKRCTRLT